MLSQVCFCEMSLTSYCLNFQTESWRFFSAEQMQDSKPGLAASCLMLPSATSKLPTRLRLSSIVSMLTRCRVLSPLKDQHAKRDWSTYGVEQSCRLRTFAQTEPLSADSGKCFSIFRLPALIRTRNLMRIDGIMGGLHLQWSYSFSSRHFLQET